MELMKNCYNCKYEYNPASDSPCLECIEEDDIDKYWRSKYSSDKIVCLVGASGSGKSTIAKELDKLGYNIIHSYTTREPREENEWGHTFIPPLEELKLSRITHSGLNILNIEGKVQGEPYIYYSSKQVIAFKEVYEGLYYWATKEQYEGKGISIYVVDPDGAEQVRQNVNDAEVVTIFLSVDEDKRFYRLRDSRGFEEGIKRTTRDREIFKCVKCDYVVDGNRYVDAVVEDIKNIIG